MNTNAARAIYKDCAAAAECVNAQARNRKLLRIQAPTGGRWHRTSD